MRTFFMIVGLAALGAGLAACEVAGKPGSEVSALELDGATFEIADAAVASNCLSMTFAVRGFLPPAGVDPQTYFPPAKRMDIRVLSAGGELSARPLGGGGGGGGNEEDGRIWMEQGALYSLSGSVPEGEEVTLELEVSLDDDFDRAGPLAYRKLLVAGPGGGACE